MIEQRYYAAALRCGVAIAGLLLATGAQAQRRSFHVPAQEAVQSIPEFARQAGIQISAPAARLKGLRTRPVNGELDTRVALLALLRDTGLEIAGDSGSVIMLHMAPPQAAPPARARRILASLQQSAQPAYPVQDASEQPRGGLEDIIVTARKITETAQTTPISISAFSSQDLATRQLTTINDLARVTPGIYFQQSASNPNSVFAGFRGQFNSSNLQTLEPAIATYQNGVYLGSMIGFRNIGLLDVDRVEVLKGPQGTLYGRNTTGGAISIYTKQPTDRLEGEISAEAGNYGLVDGRGILNIPILADSVALRLVAAASTIDGFARDVANNRRLQNQSAQFYRGTLRIDPLPKLHISILGEHSRSRNGGINLVPLHLAPNSVAALEIGLEKGLVTNTPASRLAFLTGQQPAASAAVQASFNSYKGGIGGDKDRVAYSSPQQTRLRANLLAATVSYDLGSAEIKWISALRSVNERPTLEFDALPFRIIDSDTTRSNLSKFHQWTQELDLTGNAIDNRLRYSLGAFYLYNKSHDINYTSNVPLVLAGQPTVLNSIQRVKSAAIFGQATFAVTPTFNVTGGLRYTKDKKRVYVNNFTGVACLVPPPAGVGGAPCEGTFPFSEDNISYTAGLDWKPIPGVLLYGKADRGYRSGGINGRTTVDPVSVRPFDAEIVDSYEIGAKTDLLNRRLRFNVSYYHLIGKGLQQSVLVTSPNGPPLSVIQNAAKGIIDGVEAEINILPVEGLLLQASTAYTKPRYQSFINPANGADLSSRDFQLVSKWTYTLSGSYTVPLDAGDLMLQADWSWKGKRNLFPSGGTPGIDIQQGYGVLNGQASFDVKNAGLKVTVWGKNLTDKRYIDTLVDTTPGLGIVSGAYSWPRTFGVSATKRF